MLEVGRKRLRLVAGLNLDHVRHVLRVEQLRAIAGDRELRGGMKYLLIPGEMMKMLTRPKGVVMLLIPLMNAPLFVANG